MSRRKVAFAIGLVTIVLLMSALLVEVVLRAYAGATETGLAEALRKDPYAILVEPHGEAGYRPRPERTFRYPELAHTANTNSMGFRGPTVSVPKPAKTVRIVLLGGSTTFGWGVDDGETIDSYMRQMLGERYPDRTIEVVNLAFDGYDSYQVYERLRSDGVTLDPDVVIVNTGVNDVRNAWFRDIEDGDRRTLIYLTPMDQMRFEQARGGPTLWTRTKHWLYLARLPSWLAARMRVVAASAADRRAPTPHWDALDYFERNLRRVLDLLGTESETAVVLFSTPPSSLLTFRDPPPKTYWIRNVQTTQVYRDSLSIRMQAVAAEAAGREQAVAYVPLDELPAALFLDDAHLTPEGNRHVAEGFVAAIEPWLAESAPGNEP